MKVPILLALMAMATLVSCDVRSGTAMKEMEKFETKPTPAFSPLPTPTPVDPADSVAADTSLESGPLHVNGFKEKKVENCKKFDRVLINGDDNEVTLKGACRQIMVNGDRNKITTDAAMEFVFNGSENTLSHSRFVNGKQPSVVQNKLGNTVEKITALGKPNEKPNQNSAR